MHLKSMHDLTMKTKQDQPHLTRITYPTHWLAPRHRAALFNSRLKRLGTPPQRVDTKAAVCRLVM